MLAAITFTVGALGAAAAPSAGLLVAARFVIGLAVGSAALVVPLYLSEIAPTEIRGAIGSLNQMMIVIGILAAFIVNAILASSGDWRLMLGLAAVPSLKEVEEEESVEGLRGLLQERCVRPALVVASSSHSRSRPCSTGAPLHATSST